MKIALIGHGGMGKAVEAVALERGHEVSVVEIGQEIDGSCDMAIDCSLGESVMGNASKCADLGMDLVVVATGWYDQMAEMKKIVEASNIGMIWSSNFSIGVNLYFKMIEQAAKMINQFDEYDVWGHEIHHSQKADSPSGTAKTIEKILLDNIDRKDSVVEDKLDRRREDGEIHFSSVRGGAVNFAHTIGFDSVADTIEIKHSARSRMGYALGAVKAAEWLKGKKGYYEMKDFLNF